MEQDCSYEGCILALYMKAKGDFVLVGSCWGPRGILCWWVRVGDQGGFCAGESVLGDKGNN